MRIMIAVLLACVLTACGSTTAAPDDTTGASPAASELASPSPAASEAAASEPAASIGLPDASSATSGEAPEEVVAQVSQLLEQQFNVDAANITVESVEPMEWNDGALGCPEPGKFYTQAIVSGYVLTVSDGSQSHEVHTNEDGSNAVVCENGRPVQP